jgi:hypothetical protein
MVIFGQNKIISEDSLIFGQVKICGITGKLMKRVQNQGTSTDISDLTKGVYVIKLIGPYPVPLAPGKGFAFGISDCINKILYSNTGFVVLDIICLQVLVEKPPLPGVGVYT